ncbi:PEX5-related protein isoform X3 [Homo sapiens]|nr:PEX5-related protein isoform X3 [Homo sapiens]XP_054202795.1 PEX5-related protein isoform X3 [Homo sapiens]|eukprot:XP_024309360.1 PEX5-related protein isoform X3 [Homo sapiens]
MLALEISSKSVVLWSASSGKEATASGIKNSGMSDSEMDGRTHIPSLLNALLSRNRVMQMSYLKSKEQGYGKLSSDEDLEIIVDQKQVVGVTLKKKWHCLQKSDLTLALGKGSRAADKAVAMVMKEIPREESAEEKPLLTMTSQLVNEQQESRPLLSPSIDDFLCETKSEAIARPVTSNTADIQTQLEKWDDVKFHGDRNTKGHPMAERKSSSSRTGSKELLWSSEHRSQPELSGGKSALNSESASELELVAPTQARLTKEHRWGSALLSRNHSLEEEFERAKAAVESDTEFWDKMQAEWEEMARRNWISENQEAQNQVTISASEKGYYFHTENPFKDWPGAFEEGLKRLKEGDLPVTILFMEAAILQDPGDAEAWQFLGITQAENENEQAAIVALQRCLELQPNNLKALMALAVSYTNTGHQQDACDALKNWIKQNPKYKYLVKSKKGSPGLTRRMSKSPVDSSVLEGVKELYLEAAHQNGDMIDPDLQTGLGVLFHLSGEFNRAIDAFNAALTVRPEDYSLWNRLGATLANGDRSEEAVEAYTRALEIQPGFIRSRYNLGISCINLGAYREAVSNFLTALSLQRKSRNQQQVPHPAISGNIWAALRIALSLMDQPELFQAANLGDLDVLLRAFNLDP